MNPTTSQELQTGQRPSAELSVGWTIGSFVIWLLAIMILPNLGDIPFIDRRPVFWLIMMVPSVGVLCSQIYSTLLAFRAAFEPASKTRMKGAIIATVLGWLVNVPLGILAFCFSLVIALDD